MNKRIRKKKAKQEARQAALDWLNAVRSLKGKHKEDFFAQAATDLLLLGPYYTRPPAYDTPIVLHYDGEDEEEK